MAAHHSAESTMPEQMKATQDKKVMNIPRYLARAGRWDPDFSVMKAMKAAQAAAAPKARKIPRYVLRADRMDPDFWAMNAPAAAAPATGAPKDMKAMKVIKNKEAMKAKKVMKAMKAMKKMKKKAAEAAPTANHGDSNSEAESYLSEGGIGGTRMTSSM